MSYEIQYDTAPDNLLREQSESVEDIREFLGDEIFELVEKDVFLGNPKLPYETFIVLCDLMGLSEYPIRAWFMKLFPERAYETI
jgi:hypothetical protein